MSDVREPSNQPLVVRAQAFDQLASRFIPLYDFGIWALPFWGGRLCRALPHIQGPRVLEVSFGTGYLLSRYAGRFDTTGVDYNPRMVEAAQRRLTRAGLRARLLHGDAHALPFPNDSFDTLVNTDAFTLYADPARAMAEFHRVLRPGGRLILLEYNRPKRPSWLGNRVLTLSRWLKMPFLDFDALLDGTGFDYEDHAVGFAGVLHMYVAHKREPRARRITASETGAAPARS
jgi:ubiquinone/menaquinone biosynthesis C-methylase UbiE